ncbi:TetR family transcriptional regulator [Halotalea alkalilenta]|uniref:HTH tetR-type domain-containing protein n=1 Tax=Halotalea alkalilenta TaxID=376489 RepID=A0A172YFV6_9GAMM|nr:TetR family transcriptional regulator [Halotalea alkalilenta]ANF57996.1 hypothetical protein A5892_11425 [Halotalea alkalilenta]
MARRTKAEAEATRSILLDAAEEIFFEKGVSTTSLEQIARRAGMTRGAVYWHFENKVSLLEALIDRAKLPLQQMLDDLTDEGLRDHPIEGLKAVLKLAMSRCEEPRYRRIYTIIVYRCEFFDELSSTCREKDSARDTLMLIQRQFERADREGLLAEGVPPDTAARLVHLAMMGAVYDWLRAPDSYSLSDEGARVIDLLFSRLTV